jgi:hypothetical protein
MKDEIVSFEVAKLAKEKGFDLACYDCFNSRGHSYSNGWCERLDDFFEDGIFYNSIVESKQMAEEYFVAPTQSLLQRWLREEHNTHITVDCKNTKHSKGMFSIYVGNNNETVHTYFGHVSYEEALEKGLLQALKFIKI